MIYHGDLFDVLPKLEANSIDACVTDPPYDLTNRVPDVKKCRDCGRVCGGNDGRPVVCPRCGGELFNQRSGQGGGGFMGKAWDATGVAFNVETWQQVYRVLKPGAHLVTFGGTRTFHRMTCAIEDAGFEIRDCLSWLYGQGFPKSLNLGDGRGTALKPSWEPIVLARKPLIDTLEVNAHIFGTGALNIDACRTDATDVDLAKGWERMQSKNQGITTKGLGAIDLRAYSSDRRWPPNVLLDEEAALLLDEQTGILKASRFMYIAKPSRAERDEGCYDLKAKSAGEATDRIDGTAGLNSPRAGAGRTGGSKNFHPTVKPIELMQWLVTLVTPPGGFMLDPFMGSGTTGIAARLADLKFVGVERELEYVEIARRRISETNALFLGEEEVQ